MTARFNGHGGFSALRLAQVEVQVGRDGEPRVTQVLTHGPERHTLCEHQACRCGLGLGPTTRPVV